MTRHKYVEVYVLMSMLLWIIVSSNCKVQWALLGACLLNILIHVCMSVWVRGCC